MYILVIDFQATHKDNEKSSESKGCITFEN